MIMLWRNRKRSEWSSNITGTLLVHVAEEKEKEEDEKGEENEDESTHHPYLTDRQLKNTKYNAMMKQYISKELHIKCGAWKTINCFGNRVNHFLLTRCHLIWNKFDNVGGRIRVWSKQSLNRIINYCSWHTTTTNNMA